MIYWNIFSILLSTLGAKSGPNCSLTLVFELSYNSSELIKLNKILWHEDSGGANENIEISSEQDEDSHVVN